MKTSNRGKKAQLTKALIKKAPDSVNEEEP